jgi:hypothetical protein
MQKRKVGRIKVPSLTQKTSHSKNTKPNKKTDTKNNS